VPSDTDMLIDIQKRVQKIELLLDEAGTYDQRTDLLLDHLEGRALSAPGAGPRNFPPIRDLVTRICQKLGVSTGL
jgi:hypothetical protein